MKPAGWVLLIFTWSLVLGLLGFCYYRMFRAEDIKNDKPEKDQI